MASFREQLERVERYYARFKTINDGMVHSAPSESYIDDIYAFFQNCYHLKDWLINDSAYAAHSKNDIERHITNSLPLSICADICNASKHLSLSSTPRSGSVPKVGAKHIEIGLHDSLGGTELPTTIKLRMEIEHNGTTFDAFQIAKDALSAWKLFL